MTFPVKNMWCINTIIRICCSILFSSIYFSSSSWNGFDFCITIIPIVGSSSPCPSIVSGKGKE